MIDLLKIADSLSAAGLDHPAVDDAVIKLTNMAKAEPVAWADDAEKWGNALNEASWTFIETCPEKSALLFNTAKGALRAAILRYAELVEAVNPAPAHPARGVVDEVIATLDQIGGLTRALRQGGPAPEDLQGLSDALTEATNMAHEALHALQAAQPAVPSVPESLADDEITLSDVSGVLGEIAEQFDGGEYHVSEETRRVLIDFAHGITDHPLFSIVGRHFVQSRSAWLIEHRNRGWWRGFQGGVSADDIWCRDANRAIRFSREVDAANAIDALGLSVASVFTSEYTPLAATPKDQPAQGVDGE